MSKFMRPFVVFCFCALAAGCATSSSDPESTTRIESEPSGATCTLENNKGYSKQVVTPATVTLHRDLAPLSIACVAPDHASFREEFRMVGNDMVLGNFLAGGLIGVAVDAASGASEKFPEHVTILLDPSIFDSIADRDRWYEKKKARLKKEVARRDMDLDQEYRGCTHSKRCGDLKEELEEYRIAELTKLEKARATATVRQPSTIIKVKGRKTCLVQTGDKTWESRPCAAKKKPEPKRARIKVDGRDQCLVQVKPNTWETRPCSN